MQISDKDAEGLRYVGDVHRLVMQTLRQRGEDPDDMLVWERLKGIVVSQLGVRPEQVTRSASFIEDLGVD